MSRIYRSTRRRSIATLLLAAALTVALIVIIAPVASAGRLHPNDLRPPTPTVDVPERPTVRVSRGQSLSLIADKHNVPGGWRRLAWLNRREVMPDPDLIEVGTQLTIPLRDGKKIAWTPSPPPTSAAGSSVSAWDSSPAPASPQRSSSNGIDWTALANCESGGNPRAVSSSGTYRGAFQFDLSTWRSVGMTGDPIAHSYGVQLAAAQRLYASRGRAPWPHCGRLL